MSLLQKDVAFIEPEPSQELGQILAEVLKAEAQTISELAVKLPSTMEVATDLIASSTSSLIVAGIGKSGHIGRKIASTMRSLGTRAIFLHAAEASHGDLGIIEKDSVVLLLSNSGETPELGDLLAYCKAYGNPIVSITSNAESSLGRASKICISYGVQKEACVNGLAPTVTTTVSLAIGDALAVGVSYLRQQTPEDFRRFHPGGKLGAQLKTVHEIMRTTDLPFVQATTHMTDVIVTMSEKGLGVALVQSDTKIGLITDGDLRRHAHELWQCTAEDILSNHEPLCISNEQPLSEALNIMQSNDITSLLVFDDKQEFCGLVTLHDCLRAGLQE